MTETIPIGADHAGFQLKEQLKVVLRGLGYDVADVGTRSEASVDYPDFAHQVASQVEHGLARQGILICGTGQGMAAAANRHHGVRAAVVWNPEIARLARAHNDANVLALPARFLDEGQAVEILKAWLDTPFDDGRHSRRVAKIEPETA